MQEKRKEDSEKMVECQPMTEVEETEEGAGRTSATKEESQI